MERAAARQAAGVEWSRLAPLAPGGATALLLGLAVTAASMHGSPLRPGAPELSDLPSVVFLLSAGAAAAAYLAGLVVVRRRRASVAGVCAIAALVQLLPLAGPLLGSRDVYAYWAYGRIADQHATSPYARRPAQFPHDPAVRSMAAGWRATTSVYGPVFTGVSSGLAGTVGHSAEEAAFEYRALAAAGMVAVVGLSTLVAPVPAFAAAFVGWNPLLALDFAGGGHNDVWMMAFVLVGLVLAARARPRLAGAGWALAAGLKWVPLAFLPLSLLSARRDAARRLALGFAAAAAAVAAPATAYFGTGWLTAANPLRHRHAHWAIASRLTELGLPAFASRAVVLAPLVVGLPPLLRAARAGRPRLGVTAALLLVASPWVLPWYAVWAVALAAVEEDRLAWALALALTAYLLPDRVPL